MAIYQPKQGDYVYLTFDPQSGHEQKGRRPALVVSKDLFNRATGMAMVCPVTNTRRDYPFHVPVGEESTLTGYIMVEQVKSIDFQARKISLITQATKPTLNEVLSILDSCIY